VEEAGLRPMRVELIRKTMVHHGSENLAAWIRTTWLPYTERVTPDQREVFIAAIVSRYAELYPADDEGRFSVRMVRLEVEALKE
jgi:trans-aconitate methyltransferase